MQTTTASLSCGCRQRYTGVARLGGPRGILVVTGVIAVPLLIALGAARIADVGGGKKEKTPLARLQFEREVAISRLPGPQSEVAVTVDPTDNRVLLAGSNDIRARRMAVYSSTDGGRRWQIAHLPLPVGGHVCATSDPSVAIDGRGVQYYAFLGLRCTHRLRTTAVFVATRRGVNAGWRTLPVPAARRGRLTLGDDRPMLIVDNAPDSPNRGRLYIGWTRFSIESKILPDPDTGEIDLVDATALISHSDDRGRTWVKPFVLSRAGAPLEVRLAAGVHGAIYAVWRESKTNSIYISRSGDGSAFSAGKFVAASVVPRSRSCHGFRSRIPAQPMRCVSPNPVISVDTSPGPHRGTVYITYGSTSLNQSQDVFVAAFDPQLRPILGVRRPQQVGPLEAIRGPDQFLPASAVDLKTGRLWVCYYQSGRGAAARAARYACTASDDGGRTWLTPSFVARVTSNETRAPANRRNGYGDYEGVAAFAGGAYAIWTDGRDLRRYREEIYGARAQTVTGDRRE
jgi:hypothetical protein